MYKITIDCTDRNSKVIRLYEILSDEPKLLNERIGDFDLPSTLTEFLQKNHLKFEDIEKYENVQGHGSFTGIKTGACVINTINWAALKKEISQINFPDYGKEPNIQK